LPFNATHSINKKAIIVLRSSSLQAICKKIIKRIPQKFQLPLNIRRELMASEDRGKAIDLAFTQIEKQFGKGSIMKLGQSDALKGISVISTGSISLDSALGVGGVPRGRIVEIYGPEASGKTSLTLHIIAEAQKTGGVAAFLDAEHALDPQYAQNLGVNLDELLLSQPDTGEQTLEIAEVLVRSGAVDVIVIDSVAALVPKAELDGDMGDSHMGLQARLMSQAMRKLAGVVNKSKTCLIFINQIRMKIGVMFGSPETTSGGNALKFYSSVRMDIRRIAAIKDGDSVIGNRTRVKLVKNKVAPPFRDCEFDIIYGQGISKIGDLLDLAVTHELVAKAGTWFSYNETRIGQGRANSQNFLKENPAMCEEIEFKLREKLGLNKEPANKKEKKIKEEKVPSEKKTKKEDTPS
jgi:recombination protein RecA